MHINGYPIWHCWASCFDEDDIKATHWYGYLRSTTSDRLEDTVLGIPPSDSEEEALTRCFRKWLRFPKERRGVLVVGASQTTMCCEVEYD